MDDSGLYAQEPLMLSLSKHGHRILRQAQDERHRFKSAYSGSSFLGKYKNILFLLYVFIASVAIVTMPYAQSNDSKEMRDLRLRLQESQLNLDQAEARIVKSEASVTEARSLYAQGLYSKTELDAAENEYNSAKLNRAQAGINLEKTRLTFLSDASRITLEKAVLYRDDEGIKHVSVTLFNSSNPNKLIDAENTYSADQKQALLQIENITVSIYLNNNLIGKPFEQRINSLRFGTRSSVDFILQKETDNLQVRLNYNQKDYNYSVYLEKEASEDRVDLQSRQFSQEGELGNAVSYDFDLERLVDSDSKNFETVVIGLPSEFSSEFYEKDSRLSSLRFKQGGPTRQLKLTVHIPQELTREQVDKKIAFFALIVDKFGRQRLNQIQQKIGGRAVLASDLDSAKLSYETLELIPRGRAELTISANNLFYKVKLKDIITFKFKIQNTGTVALDRVRIKLDLPLDWSAEIMPEKDITVDIQQSVEVEAQIIPASDAVVGDQEITINTTSDYQGREIKAEPKRVRVEIEGKSNVVAGVLLILVLVGLVVGVAVYTIKISRR